jgi:2-keto-3-deoxy-L-rhamnonate aldolase RhmA
MTFKQLLASPGPAIGVIITLPDPTAAEIFVRAGFDWLWIDAEHAPLGAGEVQRIAQAAGPIPCLARIPGLDEGWVKKTLDTGVDGIIFPLVNSAADAGQAVAMCKYPPLGRRSVGVGRAQGYGPGFAEYVRTANDRTVVVAQIEHIHAVEAVDEILSTPGLDAALVGPYDLSNSMGKPGQVSDAEVQAAITHVREACQRRGIPVGIFTGSPDAARAYIAAGFKFVGLGVDVMLLAEMAAATLGKVKGV